MLIPIGIDESVVQESDTKYRFIYVASYSKKREDGTIKKSGISKRGRRKICDGTKPFFLNGGFAATSFVFESGNNDKRDLRKKHFQSISSLIDSILNNAEVNNSYRSNINIIIDGEDIYHIKDDLVSFLGFLGYGNRAHVNFVIKGDKKVGVVNKSDTIAYILRRVCWDYFENGNRSHNYNSLMRIFAESNPVVRSLAEFFIKPYYPIEHYSKKSLERRVA